MTVEQPISYASALYGILTIGVFIAPLYIYASEFHESKKQKGSVGAGDYIKTVMEGLAIHALIIFYLIVGLMFIDLITKAAPDLRPSIALQTFYLDGYVHNNEWVKGWIDATYVSKENMNAPIAQATGTGYSVFMKLVALAVSLLFTAIPFMIVLISISLSIEKVQENETILEKVGHGLAFFFVATLLVFIHSLYASMVVSFVGDISNFSFFEAMTRIWHMLFFGVSS